MNEKELGKVRRRRKRRARHRMQKREQKARIQQAARAAQEFWHAEIIERDQEIIQVLANVVKKVEKRKLPRRVEMLLLDSFHQCCPFCGEKQFTLNEQIGAYIFNCGFYGQWESYSLLTVRRECNNFLTGNITPAWWRIYMNSAAPEHIRPRIEEWWSYLNGKK